MSRDSSCKERIGESLKSTIDDIREAIDSNELFELGLGFDYVAPGTFSDQDEGYWRYQLSWGGPSDEVRFFASDPEDRVPAVEYWFLDWFDGASRNLHGNDLDLLHTVWNDFMDIGSVEHAYNEAE